jgi:hypothetical protein
VHVGVYEGVFDEVLHVEFGEQGQGLFRQREEEFVDVVTYFEFQLVFD